MWRVNGGGRREPQGGVKWHSGIFKSMQWDIISPAAFTFQANVTGAWWQPRRHLHWARISATQHGPACDSLSRVYGMQVHQEMEEWGKAHVERRAMLIIPAQEEYQWCLLLWWWYTLRIESAPVCLTFRCPVQPKAMIGNRSTLSPSYHPVAWLIVMRVHSMETATATLRPNTRCSVNRASTGKAVCTSGWSFSLPVSEGLQSAQTSQRESTCIWISWACVLHAKWLRAPQFNLSCELETGRPWEKNHNVPSRGHPSETEQPLSQRLPLSACSSSFLTIITIKKASLQRISVYHVLPPQSKARRLA